MSMKASFEPLVRMDEILPKTCTSAIGSCVDEGASTGTVSTAATRDFMLVANELLVWRGYGSLPEACSSSALRWTSSLEN